MAVRGWVFAYLCISVGCGLVCSEVNKSEKLRQKRAIGEVAGAIITGAIDAGTSLTGTTVDAAINSNPVSVSVGIVVENWTKWRLTNPVLNLHYGQVSTPAPINVDPGKEEMMVACKSYSTATGSSGVLSYYIPEIDKSVYVMWSVPYNHDHHGNWLAVSVGARNRRFSFKEMYYGLQHGFIRRQYYYSVAPIRYSSSGVTVEGTMGTWKKGKVVIIVKPTNKANLAPSFKDVITQQL